MSNWSPRGAALMLLLLPACSSGATPPPEPPPAPPPTNDEPSPAPAPEPPGISGNVPAVSPTTTPIDLVPGRVRNAYPFKSDRGKVLVDRVADGWRLQLSAPPPASPDQGQWAGFCWDLSAVDASDYRTLVLDLTDVEEAAELEVKLERQNNKIQDPVQQYIASGELAIDMTVFPRVREEVARVCIAAVGSSSAARPTSAKFKLTRVTLR